MQLRRPHGFTLLEAIVAMVIMATALLALYSWLSANTIAMNRVVAQASSLEDARTALALVETINPMATPGGEREAGPLLVRWSSEPVAGKRPGLSQAGLPTQFDLTLYEISVQVLRDGREVRAFSFRKAGWVAARPIQLDDEY